MEYATKKEKDNLIKLIDNDIKKTELMATKKEKDNLIKLIDNDIKKTELMISYIEHKLKLHKIILSLITIIIIIIIFFM